MVRQCLLYSSSIISLGRDIKIDVHLLTSCMKVVEFENATRALPESKRSCREKFLMDSQLLHRPLGTALSCACITYYTAYRPSQKTTFQNPGSTTALVISSWDSCLYSRSGSKAVPSIFIASANGELRRW